jgi:YVTN family beta-propeller protein
MGTTFTAAAAIELGPQQGSAEVPSMVGLGNRALQIPSVLYLQDDGDFLVGEAAERRGQSDPSRVVREFKRRLGDPVPLIVGGTPFSAQVLSAKLLSWVVAAATERRGAEPDEIVLTHPANWGLYRREYFDQIIALADIGPASTCPEPQAAAIQYAAEARLDRGSRVLVYDLGGGTFDVCVLEKTLYGFKILGTPEGIEHLGGIDFDEAVFRQVLESLGDLDLEGPAARAGLIRLRRDCVEAKEALSVDVETVIPVSLPGRNTSVRLTRGELESLIEPALTDTMDTTARALRAAGTSPQRLTAIVLVGGSSRIPLVSHLLQNRFDTPTALDTHPKHVIALGAVLFNPQGPRRRPADKPTALIPVVLDEPPTTPVPPGPTQPAAPEPDTADAGPASTAAYAATAPTSSTPPSGSTSPSAATSPSAPTGPIPPTGSTGPAGTVTPAGAPAYGRSGAGLRGRVLALGTVVLAAAGIATAAVLFATRDNKSGEAGTDPGTFLGASTPTGAGSSTVPIAALYGVAVSPNNSQLYVSHLNADTLSVVNELTGQLMRTVPVGDQPLGVAVSEITGDIYVANHGSDTVTRINGSTLEPAEGPIKVGKQPQSIIVLPGKETAYVTNVGDGTVSILNLSTNTVVKTVSVGDKPINLTSDARGRRVYVANSGSSTVSVINPASRTVVRTLQVDKSPHDIAVSPDSELLYVTSKGSSEIAVVDATSGASRAPITVGAPAVDLVAAPDVRRLYATLAESVAVIDTTTRATTAHPIAIDGPAGIALGPGGKRLYVTANRTGSLTTIDTATDQPLGEPVSIPTPTGTPS